jgi:hypothetical protein
MKTQETFNVVMLPTEKASLLVFTNNKLYYSDLGHLTNDWINQHLYIISNNTIVEGDWVLINNSFKVKVELDGSTLGYRTDVAFLYLRENERSVKKIVASTDKDITPSTWIGESFVQVFIKNYNEGKVIDSISLEKDDYFVSNNETFIDSINAKGNYFTHGKKIKTRPDGSVIIHPNKTYSQAEVDSMLDRQVCQTTDQLLKKQAKMYSTAEVEAIANSAWYNGYWNKYEEINGEGESGESALSPLNFIKQNVNKI